MSVVHSEKPICSCEDHFRSDVLERLERLQALLEEKPMRDTVDESSGATLEHVTMKMAGRLGVILLRQLLKSKAKVTDASVRKIVSAIVATKSSRECDPYPSEEHITADNPHQSLTAHPSYFKLNTLQVVYYPPVMSESIAWKERFDRFERRRKACTGQKTCHVAAQLWLQGCHRDAERLLKQSPSDMPEQSVLALIHKDHGRWSAAEKSERHALELARDAHGQEHPLTLISMINLGSTLWHNHNLIEAKVMCEEAVEKSIAVFGTAHPVALVAQYNLAMTYSSSGDVSRGVWWHQQVLKARRDAFGDEDVETVLSQAAVLALQHPDKRPAPVIAGIVVLGVDRSWWVHRESLNIVYWEKK